MRIGLIAGAIYFPHRTQVHANPAFTVIAATSYLSYVSIVLAEGKELFFPARQL